VQFIAAILAAGLAVSAAIGPSADRAVEHPNSPRPRPTAGSGSTGDASLNADVARKNAEVDRRNAAAAAEYARKQAEYKQAQRDYQTRLAQQRAAAKKYEADKAAWAAKVAACKAGDTSQCGG
jgi:hypothetical protein